MDKRKKFSAKQKLTIIREHLENNVQIGELSERYGIHPNLIYKWKKTFFEKGEQLFDDKREKKVSNQIETKISLLEEKLRDRDSLISEIVQDNIRLKKKLSGDI